MKSMFQKAPAGLALLTALTLLLAGCKPAGTPATHPAEQTQEVLLTSQPAEPTEATSYPAPAGSNAQQSYPAPAQAQAAEPTSPYPEPAGNAENSDCPAPTGGEGEVKLDAYGVCFVYPAGFTSSTEGVLDGIAVFGPPLDNNVEPLQAVFNLQVKPSEGRSLEEAVSEIFEQNQGASIESTPTKVNGYEASRLEGVPGRLVSRMLVFVINSRIYLLTFSPLDEALAQAKPDVEMMWDTINQSIKFYRPQP